MESMDNFRERIEALEQRTEQLQQHTHMVEWWLRWWRGIACGLGLLGLVSLVPASQAADFACAAGDVACLIDAINTANTNGEANTITLEAGTYTLTAVDNDTDGPNGLPSITSPLTMTGDSADTTILKRAASAPNFRLVHVAARGKLTLNRVTLTGGGAVRPPQVPGGGLFNNAGTVRLVQTTITHNTDISEGAGGVLTQGGTVDLTQSRITGNSSLEGTGGLRANGGTVTITQSTVAGNAGDVGGGIFIIPQVVVTLVDATVVDNSTFVNAGGISNGGVLLLTNSTVARNHGEVGGIDNAGTVVILNGTITANTAISGGGIHSVGSGTVTVQNTIIASNDGPDCAGAVTSLGHNLIGNPAGCTITLQPSDLTGDPGLDAFTDNGRPGQGHFPLLPTSQAIDAGNNAVCPRRDQLGQRRIGPCDIGAIRFLDQDDRRREEENDHQHEEDLAAPVQESQ